LRRPVVVAIGGRMAVLRCAPGPPDWQRHPGVEIANTYAGPRQTPS